MQHVFVNPAGQDDNLGDSALRAGLLRVVRAENVQLHVHLDGQSSDYISGLGLSQRDVVYNSRKAWLDAVQATPRPTYAFNAGEINPQKGRSFPSPGRAAELRTVVGRGGHVIVAGMGLKDPTVAERIEFDATLRSAPIVSWRDHGSRYAAGFGTTAPDWAFMLGPNESAWSSWSARANLAVTLRFDRPWPDTTWFTEVRSLAARTGTQILTLAQVARDAPRAVQLAQALGGKYAVAPSTRHDDLNAHVRAIYAGSLAVVSDRAHALIMGATEGAYPIGTAVDAQKIRRLLDTAGVGNLTGTHQGLAKRTEFLESALPNLPLAIKASRRAIEDLATQIRGKISS